MTDSAADKNLLGRVIIPVASEADALQTCRAVLPWLDQSEGEVVVVHVIEKGGGSPDKASVEQMEQRADDIFEAAAEILDDAGVSMTSHTVFHTDIVEGILEAAEREDASAVLFCAREGGRLLRWMTGDTALKLVTESDIPVISIPRSPVR